MKPTNAPHQSIGYGAKYRRGILFGVAVGTLCCWGCSAEDHRISMDDFLAMRRSTPKVETASTAEVAARVAQSFSPYRVGPGDVLEVRMVGGDGKDLYPALHVRVDRKGSIDLPNLDSFRVSDMELEDVEDAVKSAYVPDVHRDMVVHVTPVSVDTTNVLVVGAVTEPGLIPLRRTERSMLFAIIGAGGVSDLASGTATLRRLRDPEAEETYNLTDPVQLQAALALAPLEHGDIIQVHAAPLNTVFVGGLVLRAGPQPLPAGTEINLLQVLAAAGGLRTDVNPKVGTLVRRMPDGTDAHVKLDLQRLSMGLDPNLTLAAGDIVWVPETFETRLADFLNRNVFFRAGVSVNYNVSGIEFMNRRAMQSSAFGGGGSGGGLQDSFDPLGFLGQNSALQNLVARP